MAALVLQNRMLGDDRVVLAWPMDEPEAYCDSRDSLFASPAERIIVAGTDRCEPHAGAERSCPLAWRVPGECEHERLHPQTAGAELYRCDRCGHTGADETVRYLKRMTGPAFPSQPDETYTEHVLGDPEPDHSSVNRPEVTL